MKKCIAIFLTAILCLSPATCNDSSDADTDSRKETNVNTTASTNATNVDPAYVGEWKCAVKMHDPQTGPY